MWRSFLIAAVVFIRFDARPQDTYQEHDPNIFVRLSYDKSPATVGGGLRHVCMAVSRDQDYRIVRFVNPDRTTRLKGKLSDRQFHELKELLADPDFRHMDASYDGTIQKKAEVFGAQILDTDDAQPFHWVNPDGEKPFPSSVAKVARWLTEFEPTDATSFLYSEHLDTCPRTAVRLFPPSLSVR
jgi:hypothetical protein